MVRGRVVEHEPPVVGRAELAMLMTRSVPMDAALSPEDMPACTFGRACAVAAATGGVRVGVQWSDKPSDAAMCAACVIAATAANVEAGNATPVLAPFAVLVRDGEFEPRECHAPASDGVARISHRFPLPGAMTLAWDGRRLFARATPPAPTGNEAIDRYLFATGGCAERGFLHLPWCAGGTAAVAPLVYYNYSERRWEATSVAAAAGLAYNDPLLEESAQRRWRDEPSARVWIGATLDAVAAGDACDAFGPWPGDLPDLRRAELTLPVNAIYMRRPSAPRHGHALATLAYKTQNRTANRRDIEGMLRSHIQRDGAALWDTLRDALLHVVLRTLPAPARMPSIARRAEALAWWRRVPSRPADAVAWMDANPSLATVAAFYVRYVSRLFGRAPDDNAAAFWSAFETLLDVVHESVLGGGSPRDAVQVWINRPRAPARTPRLSAPGLTVMRVRTRPPDEPRVYAYYCEACDAFVHGMMGMRMACRSVRPNLARGACCCRAREACVQARVNGCCCTTKSQVAYDLRARTVRCLRGRRGGRRWCHAVPREIEMNEVLVVRGGKRAVELIMCVDCRRACACRVENYADDYHCGCVERSPAMKCEVCEMGVETRASTVIGCDLARVAVCGECMRFLPRMARASTGLRASEVLEQTRAKCWMSIMLASKRKRRRVV